MTDSLATGAETLSDRAQEILRRADAQAAGARVPPAAPQRPAPAPAPAVAASAPSPMAGPPELADPVQVDQLIQAVARGLAVARSQLVELSAAVERGARELGHGASPAPGTRAR